MTTPYEPDKNGEVAVTPTTHELNPGVILTEAINNNENKAFEQVSHLSHVSHLKMDESTLMKLRTIEQQREKGEVPSHYTKIVICQGCGPVWLWPGSGNKDGVVFGCPWCLNRGKNLPVPNPTTQKTKLMD